MVTDCLAPVGFALPDPSHWALLCPDKLAQKLSEDCVNQYMGG